MPLQSKFNTKVFCLQLHKGCGRLPDVMTVTPGGSLFSGPQFATTGGNTHLHPKGGWRYGNVCKSLGPGRHPANSRRITNVPGDPETAPHGVTNCVSLCKLLF